MQAIKHIKRLLLQVLIGTICSCNSPLDTDAISNEDIILDEHPKHGDDTSVYQAIYSDELRSLHTLPPRDTLTWYTNSNLDKDQALHTDSSIKTAYIRYLLSPAKYNNQTRNYYMMLVY